jgi:hypothetical protein
LQEGFRTDQTDRGPSEAKRGHGRREGAAARGNRKNGLGFHCMKLIVLAASSHANISGLGKSPCSIGTDTKPKIIVDCLNVFFSLDVPIVSF